MPWPWVGVSLALWMPLGVTQATASGVVAQPRPGLLPGPKGPEESESDGMAGTPRGFEIVTDCLEVALGRFEEPQEGFENAQEGSEDAPDGFEKARQGFEGERQGWTYAQDRPTSRVKGGSGLVRMGAPKGEARRGGFGMAGGSASSCRATASLGPPRPGPASERRKDNRRRVTIVVARWFRSRGAFNPLTFGSCSALAASGQ